VAILRKLRNRKPATAARPAPAAGTADAATAAGRGFRHENATLAEEIGLAALDLAKRANGAGLTTLGFLLENAALEAGAEAAARKWPADPAQN
jgi:hypothetical protein